MRTAEHYKIDPALLHESLSREAAHQGPPGLKLHSSHRGPIIQCYTPNDFVWNSASIPIRDLPPTLAGLRLLHLSDLHLRTQWGKGYDALIAKVQANPPDLILFTGDFVDNRFDPRRALPTVLRLFAALRARHGVYAIPGNHDPDVMLPYLAHAGLRFITHQRVLASLPGGPIELIGFPGPARQDLDPDFIDALPPRAHGVPRIILSHYPDLFGAALPLDPDLYLAGHTHGGQICLPNGLPLLTHDRMPRRFCKGIHQIGQTWYSISNGFGFTGISLRLFCPAEVTEFTLVSSDVNS